MGGEWQKTIGEHGEDVVAILLEKIGWGNFQKGVPVGCVRPKQHSPKGNRQNHGIDFLFSYRSPLCDDLCENLVISSKYSSAPYPNNPVTTFKSYYEELAWTIHCFKKSPAYAEQTSRIPRCDQSRCIGVIVWLNNVNPSADCRSHLAKIDILKGNDEYDAIYLIDNEIASFLYDSITHVEAMDHGSEVSFAYVETGKCTDPLTKSYSGTTLPVEYVNLGLLPLKSINQFKVSTLTICCLEPFNPDNLGRIIGLSQSVSQDWASHIRVLFPDYNALKHDNQVRAVKNSFSVSNVTAKLTIGSYRQNIQDLSV